MRLTQSTHRKLAALVIASVLWYGCGGNTLLKSFRVALASSTPLVNSLVSTGVLNQSQATAAIADFTEGTQCAITLQDGFTQANTLPKEQQKAEKFRVTTNALLCWRTIVARNNLSSPRLERVATIADGILASLQIFYAPPSASATRRPAGVVTAASEKDLEEKLKAKVDELETALKP